MEGLESFFTASQQLRLFILSCIFGIPIGVFFDIFRTLRIVFPHGKLLVAAEDIIFFIFYSVFLMCFTITAARSEFRFYFIAGNLIGFTLYYFTIGKAVLKLFKKIAAIFKKGIYIIFGPINKKFVLLCEKTGSFFGGTLQIISFKKKNSETPLIVSNNLLYNNKVHKNNNRVHQKNKRRNVRKIEEKTRKS